MHLRVEIPSLGLKLSQSKTSCTDDDHCDTHLCRLDEAEENIPSMATEHGNKIIPPSPMDSALTITPRSSAGTVRIHNTPIMKREKSESPESILSDISSDDGSHGSLDLLDVPMTNLLQMITQSDEDIMFAQNGYKRLHKLCDTLQGKLYKAEVTKITDGNNGSQGIGSHVCIKKCDKQICDDQIAKKDDGMTFCVEENILKEAIILRHLTVDNRATGNYIVKFIDFFESESHYYLVTEYVEGMNLKEFVQSAHGYIREGKLELKEYQKTVKYIMWQLIATLRFLHDVFHCM